MKRFLSIVALLGLCGVGLNVAAQQTPSQTPATQDPAASTQQQPVDTQNQSAKSFEGKITKQGDKLVLQDMASQSAYQLDDQDKAKQFEGQSVKVMATLDQSSNTLHIVDITPSAK